jgi:hypothetical protein
MSAKKISQARGNPPAHAHVPSGNTTAPKAQPIPQIEEPPKWARQLLAGIENLNSRVGLIESGAMRPSFSEAASEVSDGGAALQRPPEQVNLAPAESWQLIQRSQPKRGPPAPKMGESGSGYTLLPNGKLVRNKRPAHKPLPVRQAINWRSNATTNLVSFLKEKGIGKSDQKPINDPVYSQLVIDLAKAKAYYAYANGGTQEVHVWREAHRNDTMSLPLEEDTQSWADEMSEAASQQAPEGPASSANTSSGQKPGVGEVTPTDITVGQNTERRKTTWGSFVPPQVGTPTQQNTADDADGHQAAMARVAALKERIGRQNASPPK